MAFMRPLNIVEALVLVGHEGVDLGEAAEVDALAQVVHVVQVLAPALVDDLEQHEALERAHELGPELLLAVVVGVDDVLAQLGESVSRSSSPMSSSRESMPTGYICSSWV